MPTLVYALVTVLAWGTWLVPSQNMSYKNQQIKTFHVAAANLVLAILVILLHGFDQLSSQVFWPPFLPGRLLRRASHNLLAVTS